jgi:hypothetical protein
MLAAFGFPKPLPGMRPLVRGMLRLRGFVVRWMPPRRQGHFFTDNPNRTWPRGYEIAGLGPERLIEGDRRKAAAHGAPAAHVEREGG